MNGILKRNSTVQCKLLPDGHLVVFCEKTNWAHTLTPLGSVVWEFCDGSHTANDIVKEMSALEETAASPDLEKQILDLLEELNESGLVESEEEEIFSASAAKVS